MPNGDGGYEHWERDRIAGTYYAKGVIEGRKEAARELERVLEHYWNEEGGTPDAYQKHVQIVNAWIEGMKG